MKQLVINKIKYYLKNYWIEILALTVAVLHCFLLNVMIKGHDITMTSARIVSLAENMRELKFPLYLDLKQLDGYGTLDFVFYPYLFSYIPAIIYLVTNNINLAINLYIVFIVMMMFYIMYISVRTIYKNKQTALIAAIIYTLSYYNMWNIYVRAAFGEMIAISFIPLLAAGIYNLIFDEHKERDKSYYIIIAYTGIIQSHVITSFYITILTFIVFAISIKKIFKNKIYITLIKDFLLVLVMNIGFIYPFVVNYFFNNVKVSRTVLPLKSKSVFNIFNKIPGTVSFWSYKGVEKGYVSSLSYLELAFLIFCIVMILRNYKKEKYSETMRINLAFMAIFVLHVINYLHRLKIYYKIDLLYKIFSFQQFNYRELGRGLPFLIMVTAYFITRFIDNKPKKLILTLLVVLNVYGIIRNEVFEEGGFIFRTTELPKISILDAWEDYVPIDVHENSRELTDVVSESRISNVRLNKDNLEFEFDSFNVRNTKFVLPRYYFKGYYKLYINGKESEFTVEDDKIVINTKARKGNVKLKYIKPIGFVITYIISVLSSLVAVGYYIINKFKKMKFS